MDMRQLSNALVEAREGTGEVRSILLKASFRPRLPGGRGGAAACRQAGRYGAVRGGVAPGKAQRQQPGAQAVASTLHSAGTAQHTHQRPAGPMRSPSSVWSPTCAPPGLTKIVSKLSKEGCWRKALEVYESVDEMGLQPDTALTNACVPGSTAAAACSRMACSSSPRGIAVQVQCSRCGRPTLAAQPVGAAARCTAHRPPTAS